MSDTKSNAEYTARVEQMAAALHEDCRLEWQAIAVADPGRQVTMHFTDAHYGKAHDLVRRIFGEVPKPVDKTCPTCHRAIEREAGDPHPNSPGDHDPAYHVAKAYGTTHPTLDAP